MEERTVLEDGSLARKGLPPRPVEVRLENERSYLRFVATAAVDLLAYNSRAEAAEALGMKPSNLSVQLNRSEGPSTDFLERLERHYLAVGNRRHNGAPWLTGFERELRLRGKVSEKPDARPNEYSVKIPGGWFYNLSSHHMARNSTEAFVCGHALRAFLDDARTAGKQEQGEIAELLETFRLKEGCDRTIRSLLEVACGPTHTSPAAVQLLASIGLLAMDDIERYIFGSPVGFRAIRILGRILSDYRPETDRGGVLLSRVARVLVRIHSELDEKRPDPYPARSFFVEALRYAPRDRSGEWVWVTDALVERTRGSAQGEHYERPIRERVYAAFALFERECYDEAEEVRERFEDSGDPGLEYAAAFLTMLFKHRETQTEATYPWSTREQGVVAEATEIFDGLERVPESVRAGLKTLVRGALLTIDGTTRRRAGETIRAAGLGERAVGGLRAVINHDDAPEWLIEHAAFIAGYLAAGDRDGGPVAIDVLKGIVTTPSRSAAARHAALWGIGDIVGSIEDPPDQPGLIKILTNCSASTDVDVRRAAAYAAAMLARRCVMKGKRPLTTIVLNHLSGDEDPVVALLAEWGTRIENSRIANTGYLSPSMPDVPVIG